MKGTTINGTWETTPNGVWFESEEKNTVEFISSYTMEQIFLAIIKENWTEKK